METTFTPKRRVLQFTRFTHTIVIPEYRVGTMIPQNRKPSYLRQLRA